MVVYPKVSILIPTYNQNLSHLKECINSALNQTYKNIEVIISDNLSNNGTFELLKNFNDKRLRVVRPKEFLSMNDNFGFCAEQAQGEYLSFLSSDDILIEVAIEYLINIFDQYPNELVFAAGNIYHSRKMPKKNFNIYLIRSNLNNIKYIEKESDIREFFFPWKLSSSWMPGHLIKREAYLKTGGFCRCDMLTSGDVWLASELMKLGTFFIADKPLALFRMRKILHQEVDPDRRLYDFIDTVILKSRNKNYNYSFFKKTREYLILIYRLGWNPPPTNNAIFNATKSYRNLDRLDLLKIMQLYESHKFLFYFISKILHLVNIIKISLQNLKTVINKI